MVSRYHIHTIKVVLCTSLVWVLLAKVMLMNIAECPTKTTEAKAQDHTGPPPSRRRWLLKRILDAGYALFQISTEPGDYGKAVVVPTELIREANNTFAVNQFNLVASDMMSLNRKLLDLRMSKCMIKQYEPLVALGRTSVIIVFHNEAWSTLLRTVHSIINRSPPSLLHEIILVDDASVRDFLGKNLDEYVAKLKVSVRVLRMGKRTGLIRARLRGAEKATGKILTFLDSHCECTEGWLLPLMHELYMNRQSVVCPLIDVIDDNHFKFVQASDMTYGGFNWRLNFRWYKVPQREMDRRNQDRSIPLRTPTMAGGLFSINRDYFYEIGSYDEGMEIWGAENLEMSFRIWMCGGQILIVTCSHVGHVFRKISPYTWPGGVSHIISKNTQRTASVWMDEYAVVFYKYTPDVTRIDMGNITDRQDLRKRLKCKSFKWYLENIYPESQMPVNYLSLGNIVSKHNDECVDTIGGMTGHKLALRACHHYGGNQLFVYTRDLALQSDDLAIVIINDKVQLGHFYTAKAKWGYMKKSLLLRHIPSNKCLTALNDTLNVGLCYVGALQQRGNGTGRGDMPPL